MTDEISLHRPADELGQIAAAQQRAPLRPNLGAEPRHQLLASDREMLLNRARRRRGCRRRSRGRNGWNHRSRWSGWNSRRGRRIFRRRRERGLLRGDVRFGTAAPQPGDARVESFLGAGPFEECHHFGNPKILRFLVFSAGPAVMDATSFSSSRATGLRGAASGSG